MRVRVFRREGNNQYYFQFLRDDGQVILNSEGYTTEAARDNGVQSVINNAGNADRYEAHSNDGGGFYFILNAGNGQEIGRSVTFRSEDSRNGAITLMQSEAASVNGGTTTTATTDAGTATGKVVEPYKASGNEDNYKPLNFYEARITGVDNGFDSFSEGEEHYFTYNLGGSVYLISEGYSSTGARDNGIQSVTNNMNNEARYQRQQHPNGHFFFNLRAGNNKEIATSRWFDKQGDMDSVLARMVAGLGLGGRRVADGTQLEAANRDANITIAAAPAPRSMNEPKKKRKKRDTPKKPKAEKVYVANGTYLWNDLTYQIFRSGNNRYYFTFKTPEEKTLFLNADVRGFETQEQAQAVVDQIMLYAPYEDNFDGKQARNGKYYFYIKGAEGKNIGKSFFYGTAEDMQSAVGLLLGSEAQMAALKGRAANLNEDEYLACSSYASNEDGFHTFTHESGEHYFGYNHGGKTYLRSEGYTTTAARDNGIASVQKNAPIEARWKTMQDEEDSMWYFALRAGNNQEIARSCGYESEAAMNGAWGWMRGEESTLGAGAQFIGGMWYSGAWVRRKQEEEEAAKRAAEAAAAAKKAEEEAAAKRAAEAAAAAKKAEEEATARKAAAATAAAAAAAALAAKQKEEAEEEAKALAFAATEAEKNRDKEDDYLTCEAYKGHAVNDKINNVAFFKGEDGQYYFALYDEDGNVRLRSEGFKTAQERDQELSGVVRLKNNGDFYKRKERGKYYMDILYDETGREVGRSCLRNAEEEAAAAAALIAAKRKAEEEAAAKKAAAAAAVAAAAALAAKQKEEEEAKALAFAAAEAEKNKDKEDDYLPCKAYQGHAVNDKRNNVAFFKGEDGQLYFALYDDNGNVRLRSEGFRTAQERDQELSGVVRLKDNQDFYKRLEKGKYYMDILYDETGREVGRSCLRNAEEEKAAAALLLKQAEDKKAAAAAAAATAAAAALAATQKKEADAKTAALALAAEEEKKRKTAAAAVAATAATKVVKKKEKVVAAAAANTEGEGTMGWLPWILLPLLLAGVFYLTKGCYGCDDGAAGLPTPMDVSSIVTPPVRANEVAAAAAKLAATTCACNSECKVMDLPENGRAQILTRLGTNPEFGNAHDLTGPQFLGRLRNRYATEPADKKFLDELFTCMGYANGFADATADIFSVVTLPNGKTGNMGYGANHGTTYSTLNAKDAKDLEAFKVEAANGCDVHFMKTCGNHFFFCN